MSFRQAGAAAIAAIFLFVATSVARADIPSWFWGTLFNWADGVEADLDAKVNALNSRVDSLESQILVMEAYIDKLETYVQVDNVSNPSSPVVVVSGANLQVVNGLGSTPTINGVGNLIIGYDENMSFVCTVAENGPEIYDDVVCANSGGFPLAVSATKTGSHNLIVGDRHTYTSFSGIVGGTANFVSGKGATVSGGHYNSALGNWSHISGGEVNTVYASRGGIVGGAANVVENGARSAVITGGSSNTIDTGGRDAVISGGTTGSISGEDDWKAGSLFEDD